MDGASITGPTLFGLAGLAALGTVAGLDLVSVLQGMLSRPLVVGAGTGLLVGDLEAGVRIGAVLEMFAMDVVPVGASRYPDFAAATMAAVVFGAGAAWTVTLGAAVGLGLVLAIAAGGTIPVVRRWNARIVRRRGGDLAAGDPGAVAAVHLACLRNDVVRCAGLAVGFLALSQALVLAGVRPDPDLGRWLTVVAIGGGVWAMAHGATVTARRGARSRWALGGLAAGLLLVLA